MKGRTMSARAALVLSTGALVVLTSAATVLLALGAASIVGSAASLSPLPSAAPRAPGSEVVMAGLDHSHLRPRTSTVVAAGQRPDVDPEPIFRYPVGAVLPANAPHALPRVLPGAGQIKAALVKPALVKSKPSTGSSVSPQRDQVKRVRLERVQADREKADRVKGSSPTEKTEPSAKKRTTRRSRAG